MSEKVLLGMPEKEPKKISLDGVSILVKPYISFKNKIAITKEYVDSLFREGDITTRYLSARHVCMHAVLDVCTDIDIGGEGVAEIIESHGFWGQIKDEIKNYDEFMDELDQVVDMIAVENSFNKKLSDLVDYAMDFLANISQLDFSENGIGEMLKQFNELQGEMVKLNKTIGAKPEATTTPPPKRKRGRPKKKVEPNG